MICIETIKKCLEIISSIITILGVPVAIWIFFRNKKKEERDREYQTYNALDDKYIEFLNLCLDNSELDIYSERNSILTPEQEHKRIIIFEILISIFERAFLMYKDKNNKIKKEQWEGWNKYIAEWAKVENFKIAWKKLGDQWDVNFNIFMKETLGTIKEDPV